MLILGFGGYSGNTVEDDAALQEVIAAKMQQLLEEHGWYSSYGRDPILVLIEYEDNLDNGDS